MSRTIDEIKQIICSDQYTKEPYFWRLSLQEEEYCTIKDYCTSSLFSVVQKDDARLGMAFVSEWYKREYSDNNKNYPLSIQAEKLWDLSGLSKEQYAYGNEDSQRWAYSIYVLGGLAIQMEIQNDNILKPLCSLYHDDKGILQKDLRDNIAFKQSIENRHSLWWFIHDIVNHEYDGNGDTQITKLISAIQTANDELKKNNKFKAYWEIVRPSSSQHLYRRLFISLKPEDNGEMNNYIGFHRASLWGIETPDSIKELSLFIRWRHNKGRANTEELIAQFPNSGCQDGFLCWGQEKGILINNVPTDAIGYSLFLKADNKGEYIVSKEESLEFNILQFYVKNRSQQIWTTQKMPQRETAVLFNLETIKQNSNDIRCFFTNGVYSDEKFGWIEIKDSITIDGITYYNKQGYDMPIAKLYNGLLKYEAGGFVKYIEEDEDENEIEKILPIIFSVDDILIRHKDPNGKMTDEKPEAVFFKLNNSYQEWNDDFTPEYGLQKLKIKYRGRDREFNVVYCPKIERDIERQQILCDGKVLGVLSKEQILSPTLTIYYNNLELEVYQPTQKKQIIIDGKLTKEFDQGAKYCLPYILKNRTHIHDFNSENGYADYNCSGITGLYKEIDVNDRLNNWNKHSYPAKKYDSIAPDMLEICLGNNISDAKGTISLLKFDYDGNTTVTDTDSYDTPENGIVFSKVNTNEAIILRPLNQQDIWGDSDVENLSFLCYKIASQYDVYFFAFDPIVNENDKTIIFNELLKERKNKLTDQDKQNLQRLAEEFCFDWKDNGIYLENY